MNKYIKLAENLFLYMKDKIFTDLCSSINYYNRCQEHSEIDGGAMLTTIRDCMFSFLKEIIKSGKFKDTFEYFYYPGICIETTAKSIKTDTSYCFSYNLMKREFFFHTDIYNSSNLRHLEEYFLLDFFNILNTHNIKYVQTEFCSEAEKNHPELYRNKKGNMLPLMRNYYVGTVYDDNNDSYYKTDLSLGMFEIVWGLDRGVDEIFTEACVAMKWLYKFNYNLWKVEDTKQKVKNNGNQK